MVKVWVNRLSNGGSLGCTKDSSEPRCEVDWTMAVMGRQTCVAEPQPPVTEECTVLAHRRRPRLRRRVQQLLSAKGCSHWHPSAHSSHCPLPTASRYEVRTSTMSVATSPSYSSCGGPSAPGRGANLGAPRPLLERHPKPEVRCSRDVSPQSTRRFKTTGPRNFPFLRSPSKAYKWSAAFSIIVMSQSPWAASRESLSSRFTSPTEQ